jgi:hypothetical protein
MRLRQAVTTTLAVGALTSTVALYGSAALADEDGQRFGNATDTQADFTPFEQFTPLPASSPCIGDVGTRAAKPFLIPAGFEQQVVAQEGEPGLNVNSDNWDMSTQNEFGKDAGRYIYRTHENRSGQASQVSLTDLKTGQNRILAERADWEAFDGIVWTPWGTILAAEEVIATAAPDPQVPQARAGLVYEFFIDRNDPSKLDPSRERITLGDGTSDSTQDGIRARPALGAKSHEGMRFDRRGNLYGIAESRGRTTAGQSGGIFRFVPDRKGDLSRGQLQAFDSPNGQDGAGRWIDLDRTQVQIDADREAEMKGANEYVRPEDVETGQSTGRDRNNGGNTLYVALTEGDDEGVLAIDLSSKDRPFAYDYVGKQAGNASEAEGFDAPDNLALDRKGNLVVAEDPPVNPIGADYFVAAPPRGEDDDEEGGKRHQPASTVQRFASLKDCLGEPSGPYFALEGTERFASQNPDPAVAAVVDDETLFAHRQHAGQVSPIDQLIAISPVDDDDDDDDGDDDRD